MFRIASVVFFILFTSCFAKGQSKNAIGQTTLTNFTEDTTSYILDSAYLTDGQYFPFALEDLKPGNRLLLEKMEKSEIVKHGIKSIRLKGQYTEKFDEKGNKTFERWDAWNAGSKFSYEYDSNGNPIAISILNEGGRTVGKAKYKYDEQGKLLQVGELLFKYCSNGLLQSVENAGEIERYQYDASRRLVHINFDLKPNVVGCGNRITEWIGKYNAAGQVITEQIIGFPDDLTKRHQYDRDGRLMQTKISGDFKNLTTKYFYAGGLLTSTKTFDLKGKLVSMEQYIYER